MGEPAYLVHSFSCAPISHESKEENPLHALGQSVSFGRYVTDSLEWGKWSSFSHKKYVEEAEKYSRPGSVAQKKAFFEAHYKKIAAAKKAAAEELLEQQKDHPTACGSVSLKNQDVVKQIAETSLHVHADGSDLIAKKDANSENSKIQMEDYVAETNLSVEHSMDVMDNDGSGEDYKKIKSLKKIRSFGTQGDDDVEMLKRNASRLSGKSSTPVKPPTAAEAKHSFSKRRSETKAGDSENRRQGWLNCLFKPFGSRTEEQEARKKKDNSENKLRKSRWSLCFKRELHKDT